MIQYKGKIIAIKRDRNYNNQLFAEVSTSPTNMFFRVRSKRDAKIGDEVVIFREAGQMMYSKIVINGKTY